MVNDTLGANDHSSIENLDLAWNNLKTFFFIANDFWLIFYCQISKSEAIFRWSLSATFRFS